MVLSKVLAFLGLKKSQVEKVEDLPSHNLEYVEGIGTTYRNKLHAANVVTTADLLSVGATKKGRSTLAKKSGISEKLILTWVNHIDLYRIKGVGEEYADLLEASGVDSVPELATRNPQNLHAKMVEVNKKKKLVRALPTEQKVINWVAQAKKLKRVVHH